MVEAVASEAVSRSKWLRTAEKQGIFAFFGAFLVPGAPEYREFFVAYLYNSLQRKQRYLRAEQGILVSVQRMHT